MPRLYKYLYFRLYRWNLTGFSGWKTPELAANAAISSFCCVLFINIWTLMESIEFFLRFPIANSISERLTALGGDAKVFFFVAIALLLGVLFNKKAYWNKIIREFDNLNETKKQSLLRASGLWIYVLVWIVAGYLLMLSNTRYPVS
jgi:hypothetical protein